LSQCQRPGQEGHMINECFDNPRSPHLNPYDLSTGCRMKPTHGGHGHGRSGHGKG
jgi:hypothetical protein